MMKCSKSINVYSKKKKTSDVPTRVEFQKVQFLDIIRPSDEEAFMRRNGKNGLKLFHPDRPEGGAKFHLFVFFFLLFREPRY